MKSPLIVVWLLLPCDSTVIEDRTTNTTTVIACPNTFREGAGPYLAEGWTPPAVKKQEASVPKKKKPKKKKRKKRRR
jgi:hypothetical protein